MNQGPITYSVDLMVGETFNVLQLKDPSGVSTTASYVDQFVQIWKPSDQNQALLTLVFGFRYSYDAAPLVDWLNKANETKG